MNWWAFLAREKRLLREARFEIKGKGRGKVLICDLESGVWRVEKEGAAVGELSVDEEGRCLFFEGEPGDYYARLIGGIPR